MTDAHLTDRRLRTPHSTAHVRLAPVSDVTGTTTLPYELELELLAHYDLPLTG